MAYKAIFFHLEHAGKGGETYLATNEKLKEAGIEATFVDDVLDVDHIPSDTSADIIGVFVESKVNEAVIASFPNLKLIATLTTGFDHIDLKAAAARGIEVCSVPAYGENTVAEFAFALILGLSRKLCESRERIRDERLFTNDGLQGFDLSKKTIGVIGTGRIGKYAVRMAKGFDMDVVAYDVFHDDAFASQMGFPYVSLEDLLSRSDVITIHCPYLPSTRHLINRDNINKIKQGAYLINTARGAIVETAALIEALKTGRLGGAGIDVLEEEDVMKKGDMDPVQELVSMPNVIVTPHNAFNTREAFRRILDTTVENIVGFATGKPVNLGKIKLV
jgi:D-lactate dehydrogenase